MIEAITNSGMKYDEGEEAVYVCQAIQEIRKEERQIGELNKAREAARSFYNLGVDVEKIAQGVGYAVETVKEWLGLESYLALIYHNRDEVMWVSDNFSQKCL